MEGVDAKLENERDWIEPFLSKYNVSWERGFVPRKEPLLKFDNPYFACWDEIFDDVTNLIRDGRLCEAVENMPLLDHTKLGCYEEWQRAHLVLCTFINGYVWQNGEDNPMSVIPKCLAVPVMGVANYIGGCPIMSHCNAVLANWKIIDKSRPLDLSNVDTLFSYTGDKGEHWFFMVTLQLELEAAPGIRSIVASQKAVTEDNPGMIETCLIILRKSIGKIRFTLERMYERCDPTFFYTKLRSFLAGSKNNKKLPDGVLYEGFSSQPLQYSGGSAAQSSIFQTFDAALNIQHPRGKDDKPTFLETMLDHMPRGHREFIFYVKNGPSVKEYIKKTQNCHLQKLFNDCVEALEEFRSFHIQLVTRYITIQAAKKEHEKLKMLAQLGTGGTGILPFLKGVRNDTGEAKIEL